MICDACNKNEATVRLIAIIDGEKTERHLCGECVEKQKQKMRAEGMQSMLSAIISGARRVGELQSSLRCEHCGMTFDEFKKSSRLGCAHCYQAFRPRLKPLLTRLHGRTAHEGRIPEHVDALIKKENQLEQLRREMEVAVACEDFEQAALLRDQLRAMSVTCEGGIENG